MTYRRLWLHTLLQKEGMDMAEQQLSHKLNLMERKQLTMTGVTEVVSFDDSAVALRTDLGMLLVQGSQLQLKQLTVEGGQVEVTGNIAALSYEEPRQRSGWLGRLLG